MRYIIVVDDDPLNFITSIEKLADEGHKPQGGIFITRNNRGQETLHQAMVKEEPQIWEGGAR